MLIFYKLRKNKKINISQDIIRSSFWCHLLDFSFYSVIMLKNIYIYCTLYWKSLKVFKILILDYKQIIFQHQNLWVYMRDWCMSHLDFCSWDRYCWTTLWQKVSFFYYWSYQRCLRQRPREWWLLGLKISVFFWRIAKFLWVGCHHFHSIFGWSPKEGICRGATIRFFHVLSKIYHYFSTICSYL